MSLLAFRDSFITKVKSRLDATNIAGATDPELLMAGALFKQLDAVNKIDPISLDALRIIEGMTGAELDAYALDPSSRVHVQAIIKDSAAMPALAQSAAAMTAIAASAEWIKCINADAGGLAIVVGSSIAMNAVAASATARAAIGTGASPFYTAIKASNMALGKFLAGYGGADPANYADMAALAGSADGMDTVASNATALGVIGVAGLAYDAVKTRSPASAKLLAAHAGLVPSGYADMTALAANSAAMTAVIASATAMNFAKNSAACIDGFLSNYTARSQLWASSTTRSYLINNTFSRDRLLSSASSYVTSSNGNTNLLLKKGWMLSVYSAAGSTSGTMSYGFINDEGVANNATNSGAVYVNTAAAPFYTYSAIAKCSMLTAASAMSPTTVATFKYLQMEA